MTGSPRGRFVTFEGGEGSGKSTQVQRLAGRLRARGLDPLLVREPGGTPVGEAVRRILLDPALAPGRVAEAFLMEAARAELVERVLGPELGRGRVVLCDRYDDSTLAYQGGGRGLDRAMLAGWNRAATGGLVPDLTLLFDVDTRIGLGRRGEAGGANRLDAEPEEFHRRVRAAYLDLARLEPGRFRVLDAALAADELERQVWEAVAPLLPA